MRKYLIRCSIIVWALLSGPAFGQDKFLDSLQQLMDKTSNDSLRLHYKRQYIGWLAHTDSLNAARLYQTHIAEAKQKGYLLLAAEMMLDRGTMYFERGDYISNIASDEQTVAALMPLPESKHRTWCLAATQNNLGATYSLINELELAQQYYMRSINQFEKLKDSAALVTIWFNVAFLYIDIQDWQKASEYLDRSIQHFTKGNKRQVTESIARKAAMYFRMNKIPEGLQLLKRAEDTLQKEPYIISSIYYSNAKGEYYAATRQWQKALDEHRKCYGYTLQYADPYYIVDEAWEMGRAFANLQQHDSAQHYLSRALAMARQYNYMPKVKLILKDIATHHAAKGDFRQAYLAAFMLSNFTDSLVALQNHNRILLNEARYETGKKETRISTLEKENEAKSITLQKRSLLMYVFLAALLMVLLVGALYYRTYRQKQQLQQQRIDQLETEKQLMAAEAILKGEEQERSRLAKDLHDGLGGMLSGVKFSFQHMRENLLMTPDNQAAFERGIDMLDSSIKELRRVAHNMMPESLVKFGLDPALKDFCHSVSESGAIQLSYQSFQLQNLNLDQQMAIGIYRVVQELINNVLKHAAAKNALVQINYQDGHMTITVEDDGKGFDTATLYNSGGMGWSNIQSRINYLQGKIDVQSTPDKGTSVFIEFDV